MGAGNILKSEKKTMRIILFLLLIIIPLQGKDTRITILYTSNVNGVLDNCLCDEKPYGALEKIKYQVDRIRREKKNILFLDSGDFFSPFGDAFKDTLLIKALQYLKYDVMTPGDQEFNHGSGFFLQNIKPVVNAYVSTNLYINEDPAAQHVKIFKFGQIRIAVLGIIAPAAFNYYDENITKDLKIDDPFKALHDILPDIKEKADFIILLSHLGHEEDRKLALKFPRIDLIISGHSQNVLQEAERINKSVIVQAGHDGYYLGKLDLIFTNKRKNYKFDSKLLIMNLDLPNDPDIVNLAIRYHYAFIRNSIQKTKYIDIIPDIYITAPAEMCRNCHQTQYKHWLNGAHAGAYQSIRKEKKTKLLKCISCHITGFGRPDGFININLTKNLSGVHCSECHLTIRQHLTNKNKKGVVAVQEKTCTRCHDSENDPDFDFARDLERIRH